MEAIHGSGLTRSEKARRLRRRCYDRGMTPTDPPVPEGTQPAFDPDVPSTDHQRLWTPWRMRYVGGGTKESGCVFCSRLAGDDDVDALILHRGPRTFLILNRYPYNTGHLMAIPNDHVPDFETLDPSAVTELAGLLPGVTRALRRALGCDGFNIGVNVGAVAGAGVAAHLHQHVVPRWLGDANFMPILASTMVLPELIPVTYAKLRAEVERELSTTRDDNPRSTDPANIQICLFDAHHTQVLLAGSSARRHLPVTTAEVDEPLWRAALRTLDAPGAELAGWAGHRRANGGPSALAFRVADRATLPEAAHVQRQWVPIGTAQELLASESDRVVLRNALAQVDPSIDAV